MFKVVWGWEGSLDLLVEDKSFPEEGFYWPNQELMDRMAWNEEVGRLLFQFRAALAGRQSVWLHLLDVRFVLNVIDQTKKKSY